MCLFKTPKLPQPVKAPNPEDAAKRAALATEERLNKKRGFDATVITGALGDAGAGKNITTPTLRPATYLGGVAA